MSSEDFKNTKRKRRRKSSNKRQTVDTRLSNGFELFPVDSLEPHERGRVESFVASIAPKAGLIAVGRGFYRWDLRPVIALAQEEGPSVIRLLGPDVSKNKEALATVRHTFEALQKQGSLNADFRQWGEYQGQVWFRRELTKDTLFSRLQGETTLTIHEAETIIRSLIEEISLWHSQGVIHGHISHSNIVVTPAHGVVMLDAGAGASLLSSVQNPKQLGYSFAAPEVVERGALSDKADLYGLGQVIKKIVIELKRKYKNDPLNQEALVAFGAFNSLADKLCINDPFKRIAIENVVSEIAKIKIPLPKEILEEEANADFANGLENHEPKSALEDPSSFEALLGEPEPSPAEPSPVRKPASIMPKKGMPVRRAASLKSEPVLKEPAIKEPVRKETVNKVAVAPEPVRPEPVKPEPVKPEPVKPKAPIQKQPKKQQVKKDEEVELSIDELLSSEPSDELGFNPMPEEQKPVKEEKAFDPFDGAFEEFEKAAKSEKKEKDEVFDPFAGSFSDDDLDLDFTANPKKQKAPKQKSANTTSSSNSIGMYILIIGCVCLGIWYFFRGVNQVETLEYSVPEIRAAWDSKIPSRMLTVAELAVDNEVDNRLVQDIIVSSAKNGRKLPNAVNSPLLRVAFNDRWEVELDSEDRRFAVALGLAGLLRDKMPSDLGTLAERHPGVILAITASAGKNTRKILQQIPALSLANLPPPFGPAFQKLVEDNESLSCADESVHLLARFGTRGLQGVSSQEVIDYLAKDTTKRLQALSLMVSYDELPAKKVLDILLRDPSVSFKSPESAWAKVWELASWPNIDAADKLFILAGIPPASKLSIEQLRTLFSHPSPVMRKYAITQAKQRLAFKHPGAGKILSILEAKPELLSGEQLLRLGQILEAPSKVTDEKVKSWLQTNPPVEIVSNLLLSRSSSKDASKVDTWFASYLNNLEWKPSKQELDNLILHPDKFTRIFAYSEIQKRVESETIEQKDALHLFQNALANETDPEYQEQLQLMIGQFK